MKTILRKLKKAGACEEGYQWAEGQTSAAEFMENLALKNAGWYLWVVGETNIPYLPAQLDRCAEAAPGMALEYATELLSPERLDKCAKAVSWAALKYATELLSPERLDKCAKAEPGAALEYATELLSPERLDKCAKAEPGAALAYAAKHLTPARLDSCKDITK